MYKNELLLFNRKYCKMQKKRYSKEKAAEYYLQSKEVMKEKSKNQYKNLSRKRQN